jgi:hypothetical protein
MTTTNGNGSHTTTELEGTVSRVNERGVLREGEGEWRNFSRFSGGVRIPDAGAHVLLTLDSAGYIRKCDVLDEPLTVSTAELPPVDTQPLDRDTRIMRQAVLNTATAILSSAGLVSLAEVLSVAEDLEAWVLR